MRSYGWLLEPSGSSLIRLKSTFNAEHFVCRLSWSILNGFGAIHAQNVYCSPKSQKNSLKTPILGVQGRPRSSVLVPTESSSAVLVMISSKSASICNHSRARLVDSSRNRTFHGGTQIWCARTEDSLNLEGQALHRWNPRLMLNISYAGCPGLSWMVSAQFDLKMCIAAKNR